MSGLRILEVWLAESLYALSYVQVTLQVQVIPPVDKYLIVSQPVPYLPVELRGEVVDVARSGPGRSIGVELMVAGKAVGTAPAAVRSIREIPVYAERRYSETHPGLFFLDGGIHLMDECRGIVPAPVLLAPESLRLPVFSECVVVGEFPAVNRIRIEIIVEMDAVHVVARHDIAHHTHDMLARSGFARIEIHLTRVFLEYRRILACYMVPDKRLGSVERHPVRVEPGMEFHTAGMALLRHEEERVPEGIRSLALGAGEIPRPRLYFRDVESIRLRPDLEEYGVAAAHLQ